MDGVLTLLVVESLSRGDLLEILAKGILITLVGISLCSELSFMPAVIRHRMALGTVLCLTILPLLSWGLPSWDLPILGREITRGDLDAWSFVVPIYLAVCLFLIVRLCVDVAGTALMSDRAKSAGTAWDLLPDLDHGLGDVRVKISTEIRTPLTWGWIRPCVILPRGATAWNAQDLSMILQHELTHIERADWVVHLLGRCVYALYWPIPGIRQLMRQLSLSMEQACDDRVLATGVPASRYAAMLLRQARGNRVPATVSLGHGCELGIRIRYLVVEIVDHSVLATSTTATLLASVALCVPLATMQLASRPELPELTWGGANPQKQSVAPLAAPNTLQFDPSAIAALQPGPEHPLRLPEVERPPEYKRQEKPTIPPP